MSDYQTRIKIKKSLKLSIFDGSAVAAMTGLTQNYMTPFALVFGATTFQIGLLSSVPFLAQSLSQLAAPNLAQIASARKRLILPAVFLHALMWLPVFWLPYLFPKSGVWWLIGLFTVCVVAGNISNPAWGSMMADLVHEDVRGRYFSFRNRIYSIMLLVFSVGGGLILQFTTNYGFLGFAVIFTGAMVCRLVSLYFLYRIYEPPMRDNLQQTESVIRIIKTAGNTNFGKFTIFVGLVYFTTMIGGPFFSVYMLRDLGLNYLTYTVIASSSIIATLIFLPFWGRRADRVGNIKILRITSYLVPFVPLVWLISHNPWYLVAANAFSGFAWAGFDLSASNFVYDVSDPVKRTKQIAVYNSFTSIAICLGALLGGYIAPHLPVILGSALLTLFLISGMLRGIVVLVLFRNISEVRHVQKLNTLETLVGRKMKR